MKEISCETDLEARTLRSILIAMGRKVSAVVYDPERDVYVFNVNGRAESL